MSGVALAACGGEVKKADPIDPSVLIYQQQVESWLTAWRGAGFPDLDRDYVYCAGPGEVIPPSTPDPSGHSRARVPCSLAVGNIEKALPQYEQLIDQLRGLAGPGVTDKRVGAAQTALMDLNTQRLQMYQQAVDALHRDDQAAMSDIRQRYSDLDKLDTNALQQVMNLSTKPTK